MKVCAFIALEILSAGAKFVPSQKGISAVAAAIFIISYCDYHSLDILTMQSLRICPIFYYV